jgi:hypothetical protein
MFQDWWGFWWLIFPIGFFVFRAWDRWLSYQRSRHALEVMKQYAAQGKDPPPELVRQMQDDAYYNSGYHGLWGRRYGRYWGAPPRWEAKPNADLIPPADPADWRDWRGGRHSDLRSALVTGGLAGAFWFAAQYNYIPEADGPFRFVAVILGCIAAALLVLALIPSRFHHR